MTLNVKSALESKHFTTPETMRVRFQACLDHDSQNIRPFSPGGEHIAKIQDALLKIEGAKIPEADRSAISEGGSERGQYKEATARIVLKFKSDRDIKREGRPFDNIVGRMTIDRLDTEMRDLDKPVEKSQKFQDIFIRIMGQDPNLPAAGEPTADGQILLNIPSTADFTAKIHKLSGYLTSHFPIKVEDWNGGHEALGVRKTPNARIVEAVKKHRDGLSASSTDTVEAKLGKVMLFGASSGGRNAVQLVGELQAAGFSVDYVALLDAAFDNGNDPLLRRSLNVGSGDSFYENVTNFLAADGFEFHGAIQGTADENLGNRDDFYLNEKRRFDAQIFHTFASKVVLFSNCHSKAVRDGYQKAELKALNMLNR